MPYRIVFHEAAEAELDGIYRYLRQIIGPERAGTYITDLYDFIGGLGAFPKLGTVRESVTPDLRVIGFRRRISIAFAIQDDTVLVLGVFSAGRNVTAELIEDRF